MSGLPKAPPVRACPFCGVATDVPHETQAGCINALHEEIGRMRGILDALKPAGARELRDTGHQDPSSVRLVVSDGEAV
jgi:hypothetical protein